MSDSSRSPYIDRIREDTQRYVHKLIAETEQLRTSLAQAESELTLARQELHAVREELAQRRTAESDLQSSLARIRTESEEWMAQYAALEANNINLANLYVASYQLHGTLRRDAVLSTLQEIIVNLVGSEEFAICEVQDARLDVLASVGLDGRVIDRTRPSIEEALHSGELRISEDGSGEPLVLLPLRLDGQVIGMVVIFGLLPHKPQLEPLDHELFELLATHAATALYCSSLHEHHSVPVES